VDSSSEFLPFSYGTGQILRGAIAPDGQPVVPAVDACALIGLRNPSQAIKRLDRDDLRTVEGVDTLGRRQSLTCVTQLGFCNLVLRSRRPEAKPALNFLIGTVFPQLLRTGSYSAPSTTLAIPQSRAEALRALADEIDRAERLEAQVAELAPKAEFFDRVADTGDSLSLNSAAKLVGGLGRNLLIAALRREGILNRDNSPSQRHLEAGYFLLKESTWRHPETRETRISLVTRVTQRGLDFLRRFQAGEAAE
jgi:anti-repressor protein